MDNFDTHLKRIVTIKNKLEHGLDLDYDEMHELAYFLDYAIDRAFNDYMQGK